MTDPQTQKTISPIDANTDNAQENPQTVRETNPAEVGSWRIPTSPPTV